MVTSAWSDDVNCDSASLLADSSKYVLNTVQRLSHIISFDSDFQHISHQLHRARVRVCVCVSVCVCVLVCVCVCVSV
jgi:hypothetical protein